MSEEISWNEALASSGYVKLETDTQKTLVLTNHKLAKVEKFGENVIEFQADCIEEDGTECEKQFGASSKRLKAKLRPIFENKEKSEKVKVSVLRVGDRFDTQYSVKELKE